MIRKALFLILAILAGISHAAPPAPGEPPVEVVGAEFGIFDDSNPDELAFEPSNVVPHRVGQRYGWVIEVRTTKHALAVSEEYLLPTPAKPGKAMDPLTESLNIPDQRRSQVSQRLLVPRDGKIYGEWSVGPNEPAGHRRLQVLIEGQVGASFEYDVK